MAPVFVQKPGLKLDWKVLSMYIAAEHPVAEYLRYIATVCEAANTMMVFSWRGSDRS